MSKADRDQKQPGSEDPGQSLERPGSFEYLIVEISGQFTRLDPADVDREIDAVLAQIGNFMDVDRCFIFSLNEDESQHVVSHLWTQPEYAQDALVLGTVVQDGFPWVGEQMLRRKDIVINELGDCPPEAGAERGYCESVGIQSFLMCPMYSNNVLLGTLGIDAIRVRRSWSRRDIWRLRLVGEVIANELIRKHLNLEIQERLAFEQMVAELSLDLVSSSAEHTVEVVGRTLARAAEFLHADRCCLYSIDMETDDVNELHWAADHLTPVQAHVLTKDLKERLPVWTEQLLLGLPVVMPGLASLPAVATQERVYAESVGLQSTIMIPSQIDRLCFVLALATFREPKVWAADLVERLRILLTALANALVRCQKDVEIQRLKDRLEAENSYLREAVELSHGHDAIVGQSKDIRKMLQQVEQVANTESRVLIRGETGTGKGLVAGAIHQLSARKDRPLVVVNCAALSPTLIENELFGCEKGAYTGALARQIGRFETADGSTIFLDEIGELAPEVQAKLLRILEEGEFERLGSPKTHKVDVRIIAATNRDLEKAVAEGAFRQDLYFRLSVFPISVPPLRERREDIPLLVWTFIKEFESTFNRVIERVTKPTMVALQNNDWPGNVRELRNVVERAMILDDGGVLHIDLPNSPANPDPLAPQTLAELEEQHIRAVLEQTGWRVRGSGKAAELLGLNPSTLESRMKKLDIYRP